MDETNTAFQYKVCQPMWTLKADRDMQIGKCASTKKATAFLSEYRAEDDLAVTDRKCEYSFKEPKFQGILEPEDKEENIKYKGYSLTYQSEQVCSGNPEAKLQYKMNVLCNRDGDASKKFVVDTNEE